jgi:GLE1-like protein
MIYHTHDLLHTHAYIHKQAYQIACVAVDICAVIPAVAQYTLGLMQRGCPYLIPVIVFDSAALDDDAYKAALGMRPDDTVST